jgi:hypothetical protein
MKTIINSVRENEMNALRKTMMAIGGITALVLVMALAVPKTTHAVIATFVQVVNAPSQPVPVANGTDAGGNLLPLQNRDIDTSSRHAVQLSATATIAPGNQEGRNVFFQVPAGKRLVIEYISSIIGTSSTDTLLEFDVDTIEVLSSGVQDEFANHFVPTFVGIDDRGRKRYTFSQPLRAYSDGIVAIDFQLNAAATASAVGSVTIEGYFVDCASAACPPPQ